MRKIIPFLILNLIVSILGTLLVLVIWDATHGSSSFEKRTLPTAVVLQSTTNDAVEIPPLDARTLEIQSVIGAGAIADERIRIINVSDNSINMNGWVLVAGNDDTFPFPPLTVYPGGGVNVYSRAGLNTSIDLFWGKEEPAWRQGRKVLLLDPGGNIRSSFIIP